MDQSETASQPSELDTLAIGDCVYVGSGNERMGKIAYIGKTQFASGEWIGVILTSPNGKNDGSVDGVSYFKCKPKYGIFTKRVNVRLSADVEATESSEPVDQQQQQCNAVRLIETPFKPQIPTSHSNSGISSPVSPNAFQVGDHVRVSGGRVGIVRYIGPTDFAAGDWVGIELNEPTGKNDGSVGDKRYFTCRPNYGLFAAINRVSPLDTSLAGMELSRNQRSRQSQESLASYLSDLSSVSRTYIAQRSGNNGPGTSSGRQSISGSRRPSSSMTPGTTKETVSLSNIRSLQRMVKEKQAHIDQLLQEREYERSDLAKVTQERELFETECANQRAHIQQLNLELERMEEALQHSREENEQTTLKLHEERKNLEDLQFRLEEEHAEKTTSASQNGDDDSRVFELEEALMIARDANERAESELAKLRAEINDIMSLRSRGEEPDSESSQAVTSAGPNEKHNSSSKLECTGILGETSIPPTGSNSNGDQDLSLRQELERLKQILVQKEAEAQGSLARQSAALETITKDLNDEIEKLNAQLMSSTKALATTVEENQALKTNFELERTRLNQEIDELKSKLAEFETRSNEKIMVWENKVSELNSILEKEKSTTSVTAMENAVALRKLEEKLKLAERQLADYQNAVVSSALDQNQNQIEQLNQIQDRSPELESLLNQLKEQESVLKRQQEELEQTKLEREQALTAKINSDNKLERLEAKLSLIEQELNQSSQKEKELTDAFKDAQQTRDELVKELNDLLKELCPNNTATSATGLTREFQRRIQDLRLQYFEAEQQRLDLENRCQALESEHKELSEELARVALTSSQDVEDSTVLKAELDTLRQRMKLMESNASNALRDLESRTAELTEVQKQLDDVTNEHSELAKAHEQTLKILESERQLLMDRINAAQNDSASGYLTGPDQPNRLGTAGIEDKASADSQINFLNSIIVDLHAKNAELESRVRAMLVGSDEFRDSSLSNSNRHRPPRLWCYRCQIFDIHDTDNCPNSGTTVPNNHMENGFRSQKQHRKISSHRPSVTERVYCENCEIFDSHPTEKCTESQTY